MRVEAFSIAHIILAKCLVPAVNTNCRPAYLEGYSGFSCSAVPVISISAWDNITKCYTKKVMMWFFFFSVSDTAAHKLQWILCFVFFKSILRVHFPERFSFNICKSQHLRTVIIVFVLCLICLQTYCSRMCFKVSQNKWKLLDADVQLLCLLLLGFFFQKTFTWSIKKCMQPLLPVHIKFRIKQKAVPSCFQPRLASVSLPLPSFSSQPRLWTLIRRVAN